MLISLEQIKSFFDASPFIATLVGLSALVFVAAIANFIVKRVLLRFITRLLRMTKYGNDQDIMGQGVISRLSNAAPALLIIVGLALVPNLPPSVSIVIHNVASAFIILTIALALTASLNVVNTL